MDEKDKERVRQRLYDYARAIDARDFELLAECFTADARASYGGQDVGPGREAIVDFLRGALTSRSSMHLLANIQIEGDGQRARTTCETIAYHVEEADGSSRLTTRGLHYTDSLVVEDGEWRIVERKHIGVWMTHQPVQDLLQADANQWSQP